MSQDSLSETQLKAVTDALISKRKVDAIRVYREATGCGLKEAKEAIETITESLSEQYPELKKSSSGGCTS